MSTEQHSDANRSRASETERRVTRPSLQSLLFEAGVASEEELRHAFEEGRQRGLRLGEIVLARGWLDQEGLARVLAHQWDLPFLGRESLSLDPAAVGLLPAEQGKELRGCVIGISNGGPAVVVAEPTTERLNALTSRLGNAARFAVVTESSLEGLLEQRARMGRAEATTDVADDPEGIEHAHSEAVAQPTAGSRAGAAAAATDDVQTEALVSELEQATSGLSAVRERIEQLAGARRSAEQMVADLHRQLAGLDQERAREQERSSGIQAELEAERERSRTFRRRLAELLTEFED